MKFSWCLCNCPTIICTLIGIAILHLFIILSERERQQKLVEFSSLAVISSLASNPFSWVQLLSFRLPTCIRKVQGLIHRWMIFFFKAYIMLTKMLSKMKIGACGVKRPCCITNRVSNYSNQVVDIYFTIILFFPGG